MKQDDTNNFWTLAETNNAEGKPIRIGLFFIGLVAADIVWLFKGHIKRVMEHSKRGTRLDCVEFGRKLQRELPLRNVDLDRFPNAPEESIGRWLPLVFGRCPNTPGIPVFARASTTLYGTHTDEETTIRVTTVENFDSSGSIKIGVEEIRYNNIDDEYAHAGETVAAFLDCTRAHNGTTAAAHEDGADVTVPASHYYLFADHACAAIVAPQVSRKKPAVTYTSYNASNTFRRDAGSKACHITFDARPVYRQFDKTLQVHKIFPNEVAGDDASTNAANVYDEIEAESYAVVDAGNTPLSVNQAFVGEVDGLDVYCDAGDAGAATVEVTSSGITLNITGGDDDGTITYNFADSAYGNMAQLVAAINDLSGWVCTLGDAAGSSASNNLIVAAEANALGVGNTVTLRAGIDISTFEDSKGAIVRARIAIEFETTTDFDIGEIIVDAQNI